MEWMQKCRKDPGQECPSWSTWIPVQLLQPPRPFRSVNHLDVWNVPFWNCVHSLQPVHDWPAWAQFVWDCPRQGGAVPGALLHPPAGQEMSAGCPQGWIPHLLPKTHPAAAPFCLTNPLPPSLAQITSFSSVADAFMTLFLGLVLPPGGFLLSAVIDHLFLGSKFLSKGLNY